MNQKKIILFLFAVFACIFLCNAQTSTIDSLKKNLFAAVTIAQKQIALLNLCEQGLNMHPDTLLNYAVAAEQTAIKEQHAAEQVKFMYYQCIAYTTKGMIDSSLQLANQCLHMLATHTNDLNLQASLYNQMGRCYMRKNEYKEAIEMGLKTLSCAEKTDDILLQIKGKTLIGWAYLEMGQLNNSLSWHLKALNTTTDTILLEKYGILFANIALNYISLGKKDSAFYFIDRAILFSRKHENLFALSNSLAIRSQIFIRSGIPGPAEASLKEAVEIRKLIGDPFYIVSDMSQLGLYYAHYGMPEKGIAVCNEGISLAKQYKLDTKLLFLYSSLGENYKVAGNEIKYGETLQKIISLKDMVFQKNSAQALAEIQTKFDLQKKENFISLQHLEISRQHYFLYGLSVLSVFCIVLAWFLFRGYKKKQQIKLLQMQETEKQQSALAVLQARENERKRIAADLHDNLGAYAASIASNLDNISLKEKDDADDQVLQELRNNSRAIVSQLIDTIWVLKKDNLSLTAISDRIKVFIQRVRHVFTNTNIDVFENISSDILMPAPRAFHLFRIVQEAVMNALKHSEAKNVRVYMESGAQWKITISDDGKGFISSNKYSIQGHGISNMKERSKEAGLKIEWAENKPTGSNIILQPTTN